MFCLEGFLCSVVDIFETNASTHQYPILQGFIFSSESPLFFQLTIPSTIVALMLSRLYTEYSRARQLSKWLWTLASHCNHLRSFKYTMPEFCSWDSDLIDWKWGLGVNISSSLRENLMHIEVWELLMEVLTRIPRYSCVSHWSQAQILEQAKS